MGFVGGMLPNFAVQQIKVPAGGCPTEPKIEGCERTVLLPMKAWIDIDDRFGGRKRYETTLTVEDWLRYMAILLAEVYHRK